MVLFDGACSDSVCLDPEVFSVIETYFSTIRAADETGNVLIGAEQKRPRSSSCHHVQVRGLKLQDDVSGP